MSVSDPLLRYESPFAHFAVWMSDAKATDIIEPFAMTLATVNAAGKPSARQVLLKTYDADGFVFYTNYGSRKALEIDNNSHVSAVMWWDQLYRQVRIEGNASRISDEESDEYFSVRPRAKQISAWISPQSRQIEGRQQLIDAVDNFTAEHEDQAISRPDFWGGYRIDVTRMEFWQGREDRLHDRLCYELRSGMWETEYLGP